MSLFPEIKCGKCDRRYSSIHSRCPYCGTRKRKRGKIATDPENSPWKVAIGLLILLVLVVAVIILLITTLKDDNKTDVKEQETEKSQMSDESNVNSLEDEPLENDNKTNDPNGEASTVTPNQSDPAGQANQQGQPNQQTQNEPASNETPTTAVTSIELTYLGSALDAYDVSMSVGEVLPLGCKITPETADVKAVWSSSDEDVFVVLQTGQLTAIGKGTATLKVEAGEQSLSCLIRVN